MLFSSSYMCCLKSSSCALCCSIIVLLQWGQRSYMPNLFLDLRNVLVSESVKVVGGHSPSVSKM